MISIIVAIASNNAIGKDNQLLWHLPGDLKRFKELTTGHCIIMGKNTWYSLPRRPLKDRVNIVLTDLPGECIDDCTCAYSIEDALSKCKEGKDIFIIGGASVYQQFIGIADRMYVTYIDKEFEADTFFPNIDLATWEIVHREPPLTDENNDFSFEYLTYQRKI